MRFAARKTDSTLHGGMITGGLETVLIVDHPSARVGDPHACPMSDGGKPHVGGIVTTGEATVMIGEELAARVGDLCSCGGVGLAGAPVPPVAGPTFSESDDDGWNDSVTGGCVTVGETMDFRFKDVELSESPGVVPFMPRTGKTVEFSAENEYYIEDDEGDSLSITNEVEVGTVEVANDGFARWDDEIKGVGFNTGASMNAVAVSGELDLHQQISDDMAVDFEESARLSWGAGVGLGFMLYYDDSDGMLHFYGAFGLWDAFPILGQLPLAQWLPAVELSFALGFSNRQMPPPASPNLVVTGVTTVIIGD